MDEATGYRFYDVGKTEKARVIMRLRQMESGHAIESFELFFEHLKKPQPVIEFVKRQLNNRRNAVKRKAARFLKKHVPHSTSLRLCG